MELDPNEAASEVEPTHPARKAYWVMRLVRTTILYGGYLTPKLYAPKEVWTQVIIFLLVSFFVKEVWTRAIFFVSFVCCTIIHAESFISVLFLVHILIKW